MADKAFLVGINKYPGSPLRGCVNDVTNMADLLVGRYGFKPDTIRLLVDSRADINNIKQRLNWLVDLGPGDRCFFHFSGHGVRIPTRNDFTHEIDGLDEAICPVDFKWDERFMLVDNWFHSFFQKHLKKGVRFTWVSDSCHSGDLTRSLVKKAQSAVEEDIPRQYPVPADIAWRQRIAGSMPISRSPINYDVGYISGCRSDQTSADTFINGQPWGALTYYLISTLKKLPKTAKISDIVKETTSALQKGRYTQRPQAEGSLKNKPFLG